jgi:hypothetical protein
MEASRELKYVREELKRTTLKLEWYRQEATNCSQKLEAISLDLENQILNIINE